MTAVMIVSISIGRPARRSDNIDDLFLAVFWQTADTASRRDEVSFPEMQSISSS